jgi:dynein heavy chain 2
MSESTVAEIQSLERGTYQDWLDGVQNSMQSGALSVKATDRLLELDAKDGHLRVNFNDELVSLIRDAADMAAAGFNIPAKVLSVVESTKRIYRYGIVLKQIAYFYNTVDRQMIPSQQPMLLDLALAFEDLVKNPKQKVTWDNAAEVETFVARLQAAVKALSSTNRYFRKQHQAVADLVATLFSTDLLRQQNKWKSILAEV